MSSEPLLSFHAPRLKRGAFCFEPGTIALAPGRITVLMGPNGGGKTTALRMAAGLLAPEAGGVLVAGIPAHRLSGAARAARIAFVAQRPEVGAPLRVREVVQLGRYRLAANEWRVMGALSAVGLAALAQQPYHTLSAGQQQRVAVARALAQMEREGILLMDEPFAAVDPPEAARLLQILRALAVEGATILVATHDLSLACALADDAWFLREGRTEAFGAAEQTLAPGSLGALLGMPVCQARAGDGRAIAVADFRAILPAAPRGTERS